MKTIRKLFDYFTVAEKLLWLSSVTVICVSYLFFANGGALNLAASLADKSYISVVACFAAFLANDIYGFINWQRMGKRQQQ